MFPKSLLLLSFVVRFFLLEVTGVDISVSPINLNEGATLTITCREQSLPQGTTLYSLILQMASDTQGYRPVLNYDLNGNDPAGDPYLPTWGTILGDLQQRANFTPNFGSDRTSLSFEFRLYSVRCADAASFRCRSTASDKAGTQESNAQNVTVHGVTQSIEIAGAQDCTTFTDPDCARCQNFDDQFGVQPKYARMGQPLVLTCAGLMATPTSQNKAIWYKQNLNDQQKRIIIRNITELVYDPPSPNACSVRGRSTLTYYPQPTDRELRITCEITGGMSVDTVSEEMSICVEGLIYAAITPRPGPDVKDCERIAVAGQRYGEGKIAGAVLGGACGGALAALLISFIILRCTGYTLTDSKAQLRTEPRRYAQQSDPSRHHSPPPSVHDRFSVALTQEPERAPPGYYNVQQDHTAPPGNYNVQQDHTVPPGYYNVQQDHTAPPGYYNVQQDHTAPPGYYNVQQDHTAPSHYETMNRTNGNDDGYLELRQ